MKNRQAYAFNKYWLIIAIIFFMLLVASLLARVYLANKEDDKQEQIKQLTQLGFYTFSSPRKLSSLILQSVNHGKLEDNFLNYGEGWRIVNFGYLSCPDICPINLSLLSNIKKTWDKEKDNQRLDIIHVTFDPKRDQPKILKNYLSFMHPDFYGLTGELNTIRQLAKELNVLFIYDKPDSDGNYFITHSDSLAVINPMGEYVGLFKAPYDMDDIIQAMKKITKSENKS